MERARLNVWGHARICTSLFWRRKEKEVFEGDPTSVPACASILSHTFESSIIFDLKFYCLKFLRGFRYESTSKQDFKQETPANANNLLLVNFCPVTSSRLVMSSFYQSRSCQTISNGSPT
jgi:hypothetical protein